MLARELPRLKSFRADLGRRPRAARRPTRDAWGPFAILAAVIALRSFVYFGFVTFVPLYYIHDLHTSKATGSAALSVMLVGGAVGHAGRRPRWPTASAAARCCAARCSCCRR